MKAYKFGLLCPKNQDHLNLLNQLFKEAQDYYYDLRRIENSFRTEKENLLHNLDLVGNLNTIESEISIFDHWLVSLSTFTMPESCVTFINWNMFSPTSPKPAFR